MSVRGERIQGSKVAGFHEPRPGKRPCPLHSSGKKYLKAVSKESDRTGTYLALLEADVFRNLDFLDWFFGSAHTRNTLSGALASQSGLAVGAPLLELSASGAARVLGTLET